MLNLETFMQEIESRNPGEIEFHQAVREVVRDLIPFINGNQEMLDARILDRITEPDRIITFRITWENDQGGVEINRGFRVQFSKSIGPYKGGLRFDPSVNQSILKFLAFEQTFKNSLTTLPMGSGKGGSDFNPKGKSNREVMRFCQAFMSELYRHIGASVDVPAGDIGVGAREIGYLYGQYMRISNQVTGTLTGKSLNYGGSPIRTEATGYGAVYMAQEALNHIEQEIEGKTCILSGSGNVALYAMEKLVQLGAKVITLSERDGFLHYPAGFTREHVDYLIDLKTGKRQGLQNFTTSYGGSYFLKQKPWNVPADLAFPCATQNEIAHENALDLIKNKVQLISEGANMPTTAPAIDALHEAGILFLPGKAANAGGVAISGMEMSQNAMHYTLGRERLDAELHAIMKKIHQTCVQYGQGDSGVNYQKGANIGGFVKVAEAMLSQGLI